MSAKKILLLLTGGTICSYANAQGEQASDTKKAQTLIVNNFRESRSKYRGEDCVQFTPLSPLDVLSENLTVAHWNVLLHELKTYDFSHYDGVILLHGTDTLAYTASLLSLVLAGISIPVILVSSQLAPYMPEANGNDNFKAAVELIVNGIKPNVYVVYRNEETVDDRKEQTMYIHYASHLVQCANHSNNFYSQDMSPVSLENAVFEGKQSLRETPILKDKRFNLLSAKVLKIQPYVGLDYSNFSLDGVTAIVHGTYHSSTVATNPHVAAVDCSRQSILFLAENAESTIRRFLFLSNRTFKQLTKLRGTR